MFDGECEDPEDDLSDWVLRHRSGIVARYRNTGECTAIELRTIERLWFDGLGLRGLARRENVSPAAISARIANLSRKAPEFATWWRIKNRRRNNSGRISQ